MNLTSYVESLQGQLAIAAEAGGDSARELAARLIAPLNSATRLVLIEALSAAADEITSELAPGSVELRIRAGEPDFVVIPPPTEDDYGTAAATAEAPDFDDSGTARLNLRLPENLKTRIEAAAGAEGLSLNAWLIRAAHTSLGSSGRSQSRSRGGSDQFTGWVR